MSKKDFSKLPIDEQVRLVDEAFMDEIYPVLQSHGGGMEIMDIQNHTIYIRYFGACGGCPVADDGTTEYMRMTLQQKIDPKIQIEIVEGNEFAYI